MAICNTCGKNYSKWTTPVGAKGVCAECFQGEGRKEPEAEAQDEALPAETEPQEANRHGSLTAWLILMLVANAATAVSTPQPLAKRYSFLPRSSSMLVFILVMACYSWTTASVIDALVHAFHVTPPPIGLFANERGEPTAHVVDLLFLAPLFESLILLGLIELFRWLHLPAWLQVLLPALFMGILHSPLWWPRGLIVAPGFAIDACAYLYWRSTSRKVAYGVVVAIHALHNSISAVSVIAYAAWHA